MTAPTHPATHKERNDMMSTTALAKTNLSFGAALNAMKTGHRVARTGWNGKGMWLKIIKGSDVQIHNNGFGPRNEFDHDYRERVPQLLSWIGMKTADNKFVPWLPSETDILADDWEIVQAPEA